MKLTILGCSGGIAPGQGTTSFLLDEEVLIDAGTGLGFLETAKMSKIRAVFLTHSHLDHISHLPFLLNNMIGEEPGYQLQVYGLAETIEAIEKHLFNEVIWPDFTRLPSAENPCVQLHCIEVGETISVGEHRVTALPASHSVPAVGYWVGSQIGKGHFAFSGDCNHNRDFWQALNELPEVEVLIVDDQYLASEKSISEVAKHYYPASLKEDLQILNYQPVLYLTHLPAYPEGKAQRVLEEGQQLLTAWQPQALYQGQIIEFQSE